VSTANPSPAGGATRRSSARWKTSSTNAQKYGDPGTPIEIHLAVNNERAVLSVRNQGKPIPPGEFEAIFQRFVRSKDACDTPAGSWGLGLPYVRSVAQSHGGSAVVFSDADTGTVFVIDVPVDARPYQETA
jgi:signal transduction histidine kinase